MGRSRIWVEEGCTLNWGEGNIDADPLFVNATTGNYHLSSSSPCIDVANGFVAPETDKDGFHRYDDLNIPNGPAAGDPPVDIGTYERCDSDLDNLPDWWELEYFGNLDQGPDDADSIPTRPYIILWDCQPYPHQGIDEGSLRVPIDTSVTVRVKSEVGLDTSEGSMTVSGNPVSVEVKPVADDTEFKDCWIIYRPATDFSFEETVNVLVDATDKNTVPMDGNLFLQFQDRNRGTTSNSRRKYSSKHRKHTGGW